MGKAKSKVTLGFDVGDFITNLCPDGSCKFLETINGPYARFPYNIIIITIIHDKIGQAEKQANLVIAVGRI
jgi:hypothetical protein